MNRKTLLFIAMLASIALRAHANLVVNPGFETGNFTGWTTIGSTAFMSVSTSNPHSGQFAADLGPQNTDSGLEQLITTIPGHSYVVSFWLKLDTAGTPNDFSASFAGVNIMSLVNSPGFGYTQFSANVMATSTSSLLLFSMRDDPAYWHLDDVSVMEPPPAPQAINLSTRMLVQTGNNVGIGGFIITGTTPKHVVLRAIGPSLTQFGVPDALADPVLELHGPSPFVTITNDNWRDDPVQAAQIQADGLAPTNNLESAIDATLVPGAYTGIISGKNNTSGVGLIEVYDLNPSAASKLADISTRAFVSTGDNIVIAGFILGNNSGTDRIVARGIGPSLTGFGVSNALADPTLELRDSSGTLLMSNNNWQDDPAQAAELMAEGLAPTNPLESGIAMTLPPGSYTALLSGVNNGTGIGLVEVYDIGAPQHLYVGNDHMPGGVLQYDLPLTMTSTPNFTIASNSVLAVAVDGNGNLAVGELGGPLQFFTAPLSGASTPAAAFNNGAASNNGQIAFTDAGDFWAATDSNQVNAFTHPFSNASTPSGFVTNAALVEAIGTAFDSAQNLYISNSGSGTIITCNSGPGTCSDLLVYAPPYTGAPIITPNVASTAYREVAVSATQLFATSVATGRVDVYNLPITAASVPAFSIVSGVNIPEGVALDAAGNLYVGNLGNSTVTVFAPPFSSGSVPTLTFTVSTGAFAIFGIGIGN